MAAPRPAPRVAHPTENRVRSEGTEPCRSGKTPGRDRADGGPIKKVVKKAPRVGLEGTRRGIFQHWADVSFMLQSIDKLTFAMKKCCVSVWRSLARCWQYCYGFVTTFASG